MPKTEPEATTTKSTIPFKFTVGNISTIPQQKRFGRSSKFNPLLERLQSLKADEMMSFPIEKYTQIQGLRNKLSKVGFTITTRSEVNTANPTGDKLLKAFIYHTPPESTT